MLLMELDDNEDIEIMYSIYKYFIIFMGVTVATKNGCNRRFFRCYPLRWN